MDFGNGLFELAVIDVELLFNTLEIVFGEVLKMVGKYLVCKINAWRRWFLLGIKR